MLYKFHHSAAQAWTSPPKWTLTIRNPCLFVCSPWLVERVEPESTIFIFLPIGHNIFCVDTPKGHLTGHLTSSHHENKETWVSSTSLFRLAYCHCILTSDTISGPAICSEFIESSWLHVNNVLHDGEDVRKYQYQTNYIYVWTKSKMTKNKCIFIITNL